MADNIKSLLLNGHEQPKDSNGNVDLELNVKVAVDEVNNGFQLSIGSETVKWKTTNDLIVNEDGTISTDNLQNDNALVKASTVRDLVETYNSILGKLNAGVEKISSRTNRFTYPCGHFDNPVICFIIDGMGTMIEDIIPIAERCGCKLTINLVPSFIQQGFGVRNNSTHYEILSLQRLKDLRDKGISFTNGSFSKSRDLYDNQRASKYEIAKDLYNAREWFYENGFETSTFVYPYGYYDNINTVACLYNEFTLREGDGISEEDVTSNQLEKIRLTEDNFTEINESLFRCISHNDLMTIEIPTDGSVQLSTIQTCMEALLILNLMSFTLRDALTLKMRSFNINGQYEFSVQRNGLLRATMDTQSVNGISNQISFENLSYEFKNALREFCYEAVGKIPCESVKTYIDGVLMSETGSVIKAGISHITYAMEPSSASVVENRITYSIDESASTVKARVVDNSTIEVGAEIAYSDIDGQGKNGLVFTAKGGVQRIVLVATISNYIGDKEQRYEITIE